MSSPAPEVTPWPAHLQAPAEAARRWFTWAERDGAQWGDAAVAERWQWVQAMRACGMEDEAQRTLKRALAHVQQVAASLPPERREAYCTRVSANRAVLQAAQAAGWTPEASTRGPA